MGAPQVASARPLRAYLLLPTAQSPPGLPVPVSGAAEMGKQSPPKKPHFQAAWSWCVPTATRRTGWAVSTFTFGAQLCSKPLFPQHPETPWGWGRGHCVILERTERLLPPMGPHACVPEATGLGNFHRWGTKTHRHMVWPRVSAVRIAQNQTPIFLPRRGSPHGVFPEQQPPPELRTM